MLNSTTLAPPWEEKTEVDIELLVREQLYPLWQDFARTSKQETDLLDQFEVLFSRPALPAANSLALAEEWTIELHPQLDVVTARVLRDVFRHLYQVFVNAPVFRHFMKKFGCSKMDLLAEAPSTTLLSWLHLWLVQNGILVAKFLFGNRRSRTVLPTIKQRLETTILHLPQFVLWDFYKNHAFNSSYGPLAVELAKGINVRHAHHARHLAFTRKMAHYFYNSPKEYDFDQAIWYAIVHGLAPQLDRAERRALLLQVLPAHFRNGEKDMKFLGIVLPFFLAQPEDLSADELRQLLGYLQHLRDERDHFSLRGVTLASLWRASNSWYRELAQNIQTPTSPTLPATWAGAKYRPFRLEEEDCIYEIVQLNSIKKLAEEGQLMMHCVGGYAWKCQLHGVSIWSLRQTKDKRCRRLVTIEISKDHQIVQARKMFNANPDADDRRLISQWAQREGIGV